MRRKQFFAPTYTNSLGPTFGTLGFDYYYKMAFGGLLKDGTTQPIKEVEPMIPNGNWYEIEQILANEALGNSNAKGKKENCL